MPYQHGYSIYVAAPTVERHGWTVRAYRDSNDEHLHSAEGCDTLRLGLNEVNRVIVGDVNKLLTAEAAALEDKR